MGILDNVPLPLDQNYEGPIKVWVDLHLFNRNDILSWLMAEGAEISTDIDAPDTHHIILAHSSLSIFDRFCHPDWIPHRLTRVGAARRETWDIWREKVLLKAGWVELCQREGRYLGEADGWGGMRAGGPRLQKRSSIRPLKPDICLAPLAPEDLVLPIFALVSPPNFAADLSTAQSEADHATGDLAVQGATAVERDEGRMDVDEHVGQVVDHARPEHGHVITQDRHADATMGAGGAAGLDAMDIDNDDTPAPDIPPPASRMASGIVPDPVKASTGADHTSSGLFTSPVKSVASHISAKTTVAPEPNRRSASPPRTPWTPYETPEPIEFQTGPPLSKSIAEDKRVEAEGSPSPKGVQAGDVPDLGSSEGKGDTAAGIVGAGSRPDIDASHDGTQGEESATSAPIATGTSDGVPKGTKLSDSVTSADRGKKTQTASTPAARAASERQARAAIDEMQRPGQIEDELMEISIPRNLPASLPPKPAPCLAVSQSDDQAPSHVRPWMLANGTGKDKGKDKVKAAGATGANALPLPTTLANADNATIPAASSSSSAQPPSKPAAEAKVTANQAEMRAAINVAAVYANRSSTVFRNCVILVQKGKYGRKTYLKIIRNGSGTTSERFQPSDSPDKPPKTTHVLCDETDPDIIPFPNIQWDMFVKAGVATVNCKWLVDSAKAGKLMPVEQYPPKRRQDLGQAARQMGAESTGGGSSLARGPKEAEPERVVDGREDEDGGGDDDDHEDCSQGETAKEKKRNPMPLDQLVRIFAAVPQGERPDYDELAAKYPYYPRTTWSALWSKFRLRTHRFTNVPSDPADFRMDVHGHLPHIKSRRGLLESGPVSGSSVDAQSQAETEARAGHSGYSGQGGKRKEPAMSTDRLVEIFGTLPWAAKPDFAKLAADYGHYPASTWGAMWSNYKQRKQRFANLPHTAGPLGQQDGISVDRSGEGGRTERRDRTTPELEVIFGEGKAMSHLSVWHRLPKFQEKLPEYSYKTVQVLYADYRKREGRFKGRAPTPVDAAPAVNATKVAETGPSTISAATASAYAQAEQEALEASVAHVREIFGNKHLEGVDMADRIAIFSSQLPEYSEAAIRSKYALFLNGEDLSRSQPSVEQPPGALITAPAHRELAPAPPACKPRGNRQAISIPELVQIFSARYAEDVRLGRRMSDIAEDLEERDGRYGFASWRNYYRAWKRGVDQFQGFGPLATGVPPHLAHEYGVVVNAEAGESQAMGEASVSAGSQPVPGAASTAQTMAGPPPSAPPPAQATALAHDQPQSTQGQSLGTSSASRATRHRAKLFKSMEDAIRRNPRGAANRLGENHVRYAEYGGYDATTWFRMMTSWTNGTAQFKNLPENLQFGYREPVELPMFMTDSASAAPASMTPRASRVGKTLSPEKRLRDSASLRPSPSPAPSNRSQRSEVVVEIPTRSPRPSFVRRASRTPTHSIISPPAGSRPESLADPSGSLSETIPPVPPIAPEFATQTKLRAETPSINSSLQSPTKRSAPSDISSRPSKKQMRNTYTEIEEAEMAVYVSRRLPRATEPRLADWQPFTDNHTTRTPAAWVEHYRHYRARIEALVQKLGGRIPGKRRPGQKRSHDENDSEVEYMEDAQVTPVERAGQTRKQEIIIIDSDDE